MVIEEGDCGERFGGVVGRVDLMDGGRCVGGMNS